MCPSLGAVGLSALYLYLMSLNPLDNTVQASSAHFKDEEIKVERDKGNFLPGQWQLRSRDSSKKHRLFPLGLDLTFCCIQISISYPQA